MIKKTNIATEEVLTQTIADNKALLNNFFDAAFINFDAAATRSLITKEYIQHNPVVPSGQEPFLGILPILKEGGMEFENQRVIADENFVVSHNVVKKVPIPGYGDVVTFDVWRVVDGKLGEHWDNVTSLENSPNPSGRTQIDGTKTIEDLDKTDLNKALVLDFVNLVLIGGDLSKITDYISTDTYIQHNTTIADGINGLQNALEKMAADGVEMKYEKLHYAVGEGNFVWTASEGLLAGKKTSFFDLFRLADGKIVEHWDVVETIPAEMAHGNGKF